MGCQSIVKIGDNLTFSITTHDPDTGVLTDADSAPIYRVYEDETGTPVLTGTMSKLDDAGTTGFYTELIACTAANGFEHGKSYTIYISATVDSDTGGICYAFKAITPGEDEWAYGTRTLTYVTTTVAAPTASNITVIRGDTWSISITGLGDMTGYTSIDLIVKDDPADLDDDAILWIRKNASGIGDGLLRINGVVGGLASNGSIAVDDLAAGDITITLQAVSSAAIVDSSYHHHIQKITSGVVLTQARGTFRVTEDIARAIS